MFGLVQEKGKASKKASNMEVRKGEKKGREQRGGGADRAPIFSSRRRERKVLTKKRDRFIRENTQSLRFKGKKKLERGEQSLSTKEGVGPR